MVVGIVVLVVVVGLLVPTWISGWAPLAHTTCQASQVAATGTFLLPTAVVNSPFGGRGSVNSTYPATAVGYPPSSVTYQISGVQMYNGSVAGSFVLDRATVAKLSNESVIGPGANTKCGQPFGLTFDVVPANEGGYGYGGQIFTGPFGPYFGVNGSESDSGEPTVWNLGTPPGNSTSIFRQGFNGSNAPTVSTCGGPAESIPVVAQSLATWVSFRWNGVNYTAEVSLPLDQSFTYFFPANFGTWQVDDLSAPGGPGGGWAFSYSPCS
jgi:hypothetical protein